MVAIDKLTSDYIMTLALKSHRTPEQIIGSWAREKIAAGV
jgi:hypothetical protein